MWIAGEITECGPRASPVSPRTATRQRLQADVTPIRLVCRSRHVAGIALGPPTPVLAIGRVAVAGRADLPGYGGHERPRAALSHYDRLRRGRRRRVGRHARGD